MVKINTLGNIVISEDEAQATDSGDRYQRFISTALICAFDHKEGVPSTTVKSVTYKPKPAEITVYVSGIDKPFVFVCGEGEDREEAFDSLCLELFRVVG